uniref:Uncharacterized protein n=1 Tax=Ackermannviridae sp. ctaCq7 TaxID=2827294 RepID=A0A8S5R676_9CAUD|nr:MAG TPA: hypothetical protein [Ackermannviridae sp. ctaCq7]
MKVKLLLHCSFINSIIHLLYCSCFVFTKISLPFSISILKLSEAFKTNFTT